MRAEWSGIERRLEKLKDCLLKLEPLKEKSLDEFSGDSYLRDIVERNMEVAIQCCIDIANRIISIEDAEKPRDYYEAMVRIAELGVLSHDFAKKIAPMTGFRNILIHEYIGIDWNEVYKNLQRLNDLYMFMELVKKWLADKG